MHKNLTLYFVYFQLDACWRLNKQNNFSTTKQSILSLMESCYLNYSNWSEDDQQWLSQLLLKHKQNCYAEENINSYCINLFDLTDLWEKRVEWPNIISGNPILQQTWARLQNDIDLKKRQDQLTYEYNQRMLEVGALQAAAFAATH